MKKRILSLLVTLAMVMGVLSFGAVTAFAEDGIPYLDAEGITQTATNVTEITAGGEKGAGWYILKAGTQSLDTITFTGDAHLILENGADVTVNGGILLGDKVSLTIYAQPTSQGGVEGKLNTNGTKNSASIGSGQMDSCGNITINGGNITASGGESGVGIGSGSYGSCGHIIFNGGSITATGGEQSAGIGSTGRGNCNAITINGGNITATGGDKGAGIGSGGEGSCGVITLNGGNITATGGKGGAGIGSGEMGSCTDITILGTPEMKAGNSAATAQPVSSYDGQKYISVIYRSGKGIDDHGVPFNPDPHVHYGSSCIGITPSLKIVEYFMCPFCEKTFEDPDCTIEITDLNAWLAKQDSEEIVPSADSEKTAEEKTNDTKTVAANTGITTDNTDLLIILGFIAVAVAGLGFVLIRRRKEK